MKFGHSPFTRAFLEAVNKNSIIETKCNPHISLKQTKNLEPVIDLDDNIISYSPLNKRTYTQPTEYEDCFERMSFEHELEEPDFFMDKELYQGGRDYHENSHHNLYNQYSYDDIPLSDSIIAKQLGLQKRIETTYYPDTDIDFDSIAKLKLIEYEQEIVPSSFNPKLCVKPETIVDFSKAAVYAWENGVPTNQIIQLLGKSVVTGGKDIPDYPDIELFRFLTKHPNNRHMVIIKAQSGQEFFDKPAALYYGTFVKKYFANSKVAEDILEQCKTYDNFPLPSVYSKLCDAVIMLRRRTALGLPEKMKPGRYNIKELYCEPETPWGSKESELLNRLKPDGFFDEEYYNTLRKMLVNEHRTIDYVLENIDAAVKTEKEIKQIMHNFDTKYPNSRQIEKERIEIMLKMEVKDDISPDRRVIYDTVKHLQEQNVPITEISKIAPLVRKGLEENPAIDLNILNKTIDLCINPEIQKETESLLLICRQLYSETKTFGKDEAQLMEKICKHAKEGDWSHYQALKYLLQYSKYNLPIPVINIANANLDGLAKYLEQFNKAAGDSPIYLRYEKFINKLIQSEINPFLTEEKVPHFESKYLKPIENLCAERISYEGLLEEIKKIITQ